MEAVALKRTRLTKTGSPRNSPPAGCISQLRPCLQVPACCKRLTFTSHILRSLLAVSMLDIAQGAGGLSPLLCASPLLTVPSNYSGLDSILFSIRLCRFGVFTCTSFRKWRTFQWTRDVGQALVRSWVTASQIPQRCSEVNHLLGGVGRATVTAKLAATSKVRQPAICGHSVVKPPSCSCWYGKDRMALNRHEAVDLRNRMRDVLYKVSS